MSDIKYIKSPIEYLLRTGLLFEINRTLLHPLGLAMSVQVSEQKEGDIECGVIQLLDGTEDPEGFVYEQDTFSRGIQKYNEYMDEEGDARFASRFDELGYYIQNIPDPYYVKNGIELLKEDGTLFKVSSNWLEIKVKEWFDISLDEFLQSQIGYDIEPIYKSAVEEHAII